MITKIDEIRKKLENLYAQYDIYILPALKFLLALILYLGINGLLGYMTQLNNIFVVLVLALISAVLPLNGIVVFSFLLCTAHCFGLGLEIGLCAVILFLLMALLYFRFVPGDSLALILTPAAFFLRIPGAVPLALGMLRGPLSALSAALGVVAWQFLHVVRTDVAAAAAGEEVNSLALIEILGNGLFREGQLWVLVLAAAAAALLVSFVRRLDIDQAENVALGTGCAAYLVIMLAGGILSGSGMSVPAVIFGTLGAGALVWLLSVFVYQPDYAGSQRLKFEDDEYYYFVKAVPKRGAARRVYQAGSGTEQPEIRLPEPEFYEPEPENQEELQGVDIGEKLEETLKDL